MAAEQPDRPADPIGHIHLTRTDPEPGQWCPLCKLSTAFAFEVWEIDCTGIPLHLVGRCAFCPECQEWEQVTPHAQA